MGLDGSPYPVYRRRRPRSARLFHKSLLWDPGVKGFQEESGWVGESSGTGPPSTSDIGRGTRSYLSAPWGGWVRGVSRVGHTLHPDRTEPEGRRSGSSPASTRTSRVGRGCGRGGYGTPS